MRGAAIVERSTPAALLRVGIVGDDESGKTTFLGLLYAAQVKSGSDKSDDFRFHATFDSIEEIGGLFQRLMSGTFPDSATKEGIHEVSFQLGFRKSGHGFLPRMGSRQWALDDPATVRFTLVRKLHHEVSRLIKGSSIADGKLREILDGDALVILVDSTKLVVKGEEPGPMGEFDIAIDSLLAEIQRWREVGGRRMFHPIFVFSKFDRIRPEVLRAANLGPSPPRVGRRGPRAAYAEALLAHNLTRALGRLKDERRGRLRFAPPTYFFSSVRTEPSAPGRLETIRLRRLRVGGWEPDYSRDEYVAFLPHLRDMVGHIKE